MTDAPSTRSTPVETATFYVEAGRLVKGQIRREIEKAAWRNGLEIEVREDFGLISGVLYFTVRGEGCAQMLPAVQRWLKENDRA